MEYFEQNRMESWTQQLKYIFHQYSIVVLQNHLFDATSSSTICFPSLSKTHPNWFFIAQETKDVVFVTSNEMNTTLGSKSILHTFAERLLAILYCTRPVRPHMTILKTSRTSKRLFNCEEFLLRISPVDIVTTFRERCPPVFRNSIEFLQ